jgi:sec-independent protein translocase protein TatA
MFGLGIGELLVILVIVLIIFGAGKLPEIGDGLGRGIRSFRKAVKTPDEIDITPKSAGEEAGHDSPSDSAAGTKRNDEGGPQA